MKYDLQEKVDRFGSDSVKWMNPDPELIPMWVADMDFKVAPFIIDALQKRVQHGIFGYVNVPDSYYQAVIDWFDRRRGWKIEKDWIQYIPAVVPAISCVIKAFTQPGDKVVINSPAYNCFYSSIRNNKCECVASELVRKGDSFEIDFADLEAKLSDPSAKIFLFCNPHNPCGRMWSAEELKRVGEICRRHNTIVVSDEIHCEIEMPGSRYIPFASLGRENQDCCIALTSPSKSFNTAGLQIANIICNNPQWRAKIDRAINDNEVCDVNPFGVTALLAAYSADGEDWLKEMNAAVWENYCTLRDRFQQELPQFTVCKLEGTYLAWVDFTHLVAKGVSTEEISQKLVKDNKVWINSGSMYGDGNYMRINLAGPSAMIAEGVERIIKGIKEIL